MKYDRTLVALLIGIFGLPFLLSLLFYLIGLSQEHILTWDGFKNRIWAGPYLVFGSIVSVSFFALSLNWLKKDNKNYNNSDSFKSSLSTRISHTITIDDDRWHKYQALGCDDWLDKKIDEDS